MSGGLLAVCEFELMRRSLWLDRIPPNLEPAGEPAALQPLS